jgi:REP element-mobilizing transposase RayT
MPTYRRWRVAGGTYFFTLTTAGRRKILTTDRTRLLLRSAINRQRAKRPFQVIAFVLLPDHLHTVWQLPAGDDDYSTRWSGIKEDFTRHFLQTGVAEAWTSASRRLAAPFLGTYLPGRGRPQTLRGLHPLEPLQTSAGDADPRLPVVLVSPFYPRRGIRRGLGQHRSLPGLEPA